MLFLFFYYNRKDYNFLFSIILFVNVNEKVYHPLTKKFTTPLAKKFTSCY